MKSLNFYIFSLLTPEMQSKHFGVEKIGTKYF